MEKDRLSLVQKATLSGVWDWDLLTGEMFWSKELFELFGLDSDKEVASLTTLQQIIYPDDLAVSLNFLQSISRNIPTASSYYRIIHKNGQLRWICSKGSVQVDSAGKPFKVSGICIDITERQKTEDALKELNKRLQLATVAAKAGVWEWKIVTNEIIWDTQMLDLYDVKENPKGFEGWIFHIYKEDSERVVNEFEKALNGSELNIEFRIFTNEKLKYQKLQGLVVRDIEGNPIRMIGLTSDITEQKEEEIKRQRLEIEIQHTQKLESLGSLAGGVAHDMNNVLTAILGIADTLMYREVPGIQEQISTIIQAANRGKNLVQGLVNFARKDIQTVQSLDINSLVRNEIEILSRTTLQKYKIVSNLDPDLPNIEGDSSAISSAIMNLCVNSIDAMPNGGSLTLLTRVVEEMVELIISDDGEGMTTEVLNRAIEPFFTTKPFGKGTGLGLAMVYGTMKSHYGKFLITSEVGKGTSVNLKFPSSKKISTSIQKDSSLITSPPLKILLVDDDILVRKALIEILELLGHTLTSLDSGYEAIDFLKGNLVDLVILDVNMPKISGPETLHIIRTFSKVPVLVYTGFLDTKIENMLKEIPLTACIAKPFTIRNLQTVNKHSSKRILW